MDNDDLNTMIQVSIEEHIQSVDVDINSLLSKLSGNLFLFSSNLKGQLVGNFLFKNNEEDLRTNLKRFREMTRQFQQILMELLQKTNQSIISLMALFQGSEQVESIKFEEFHPIAVHRKNDNIITMAFSETELSKLQRIIRSSDDAYRYFSDKMSLYVPDKKQFNSHYAKGLLDGTKRAFKKKDIMEIEVPNFEEFKLSECWKQTMTDKLFMSYMPSDSDNKYPNKKFYFNVFNTLYPGKLDAIIQKSFIMRNRHKDEMRDQQLKSEKPQIQPKICIQYQSHFTAYDKDSGNRFLNMMRNSQGYKIRKKREQRFSANLLQK